MFANAHAVVILGSLIVPLIVFALCYGWHQHPIQQVLGFVTAVLALGLVMSLLMMPGAPIAEWLMPLAGIVVTWLGVKNQRACHRLYWGLSLLSVALCVNALVLRIYGYTSVPPRVYASFERAYLGNLGRRLAEQYPPDREFDPGPLAEMLPELGRAVSERKSVHPLWHTPLTRLYRLTPVSGIVWYPGGPVGVGSKNLEWIAAETLDEAKNVQRASKSNS